MGEMHFVKSGIPGLDKILGGGFPKGSITTIGGPSGAGKSTFGMQFLYEGARQFDEVGLYISIEESKDAMLAHMSGYDWNIREIEEKQKLVFLDYPIYEVDQLIQQASAVKEIAHTMEVKRIVIDSIIPIALHFKSEEERKLGFLKFIENVRSWGATTLILSEDTTTDATEILPHTTYTLESFTDGWINLSFKYDEKKNERVRIIEVLKMKGVRHSLKQHLFSLSEDGIKVQVK